MRRTKGSISAKSGQRRSVVLQYFPDGEALVVVATNDGGATHPAWYLNLVSTGTAKIEVGGRKLDVVATQLSGADAARWWRRIVERAPDYKRNTRAAGRTFPILRLTAA